MGHITLNRPEHLNALTRSMVTLIRLSLAGWRHDHAVRTVVIDGTGHRGLSAGEDLRALYADVRAGGVRAIGLWSEACRLAAEMASYPKPIVALMDGVVLGSAAAIAGHASHRVVREDSIVALPEVAIAMVPHIGGRACWHKCRGRWEHI